MTSEKGPPVSDSSTEGTLERSGQSDKREVKMYLRLETRDLKHDR